MDSDYFKYMSFEHFAKSLCQVLRLPNYKVKIVNLTLSMKPFHYFFIGIYALPSHCL